MALRINPSYVEAYSDLGLVLSHLGRLDEAIRNFSRALRLDPGHTEVHNNLGIALARKGKLEDAEAHFKEALRIRSGFMGAQQPQKDISAPDEVTS